MDRVSCFARRDSRGESRPGAVASAQTVTECRNRSSRIAAQAAWLAAEMRWRLPRWAGGVRMAGGAVQVAGAPGVACVPLVAAGLRLPCR